MQLTSLLRAPALYLHVPAMRIGRAVSVTGVEMQLPLVNDASNMENMIAINCRKTWLNDFIKSFSCCIVITDRHVPLDVSVVTRYVVAVYLLLIRSKSKSCNVNRHFLRN